MTAPRHRYAREYLIQEPTALAPAWVLDWIERETNLEQRREQVRGENPTLDEALQGLLHMALFFRKVTGSGLGSAAGTSLPPTPELPRRLSHDQLSASDVADMCGLSGRAVRKACLEQRLPAELVEGRWRIDRDAAEHFRANRAA